MVLGRRFGSRSRSIVSIAALRGTRPFRSAGPGRGLAPTVRTFGRRQVGAPIFRYRRLQRGGFFKSVFKSVAKVVKKVTSVPVIGAIAKAAVKSLPIVGQVTTAVAAFKGKTAVGISASPVGGVQEPVSMASAPRAPRRRRAKKAKRAKRTKRAKAKRSGGGSAKQRAARARFAAAARKGKIRKGQRL